MEDSLKRLKRGKTPAAMVGNMSDDDKIRTQIWLDVQQFTNQVSVVVLLGIGSCYASVSEEQTIPHFNLIISTCVHMKLLLAKGKMFV